MIEPCEECGTPQYITSAHRWLNNGDIVMARGETHRIVFCESENSTPIFRGMEEIVGMSLEHIILTALRKTARLYLEFQLPDNINELIRTKQADLKTLDNVFIEVARLVGFGNYEFVDMRFEQDENDFFTVNITEPYSLLMCVAGHAAAMEAATGYDHEATYSEVSPDVYSVKASPSKHPEELAGRVELQRYSPTKGDIELERCATCGGPKALSEYQWHLERGVILNKSNQRRMTIQGPNELEPVFDELEAELGEEIPRVIVEAQRRFAKTGYYSPDDVKDEDELRTQLAFKGFGNLLRFKMGKRGLSMRLDNATLHLLIVGMMQGIFDMAFDTDSSVEWELSEDGTLEVEVKPTA